MVRLVDWGGHQEALTFKDLESPLPLLSVLGWGEVSAAQ